MLSDSGLGKISPHYEVPDKQKDASQTYMLQSPVSSEDQALLQAVIAGDLLKFIECCKKGANLLIQGPDHGSLLHHAAKSGHGEIVKYILEHGESVCKPTESCTAAECVSQVKPHSTVWLGAFSLVVTLGQMST
uniref:Uncharacterized protein n=1 Tax=Phasianus colchicus TaxID=9054 RepID=A0A669PBL4_PHACC